MWPNNKYAFAASTTGIFYPNDMIVIGHKAGGGGEVSLTFLGGLKERKSKDQRSHTEYIFMVFTRIHICFSLMCTDLQYQAKYFRNIYFTKKIALIKKI